MPGWGGERRGAAGGAGLGPTVLGLEVLRQLGRVRAVVLKGRGLKPVRAEAWR